MEKREDKTTQVIPEPFHIKTQIQIQTRNQIPNQDGDPAHGERYANAWHIRMAKKTCHSVT